MIEINEKALELNVEEFEQVVGGEGVPQVKLPWLHG